VHTGTDVLDPTWDLYGQLWLLDRTADGARLVDVRKGAAHGVPAPGITGKDVRDMVISRDGTRLVAEERRGGHDVLVVARISRSQPGALPTVQRVRRLPLSGIDVQRIRDLAWRTPGSVAVLVGTPARTSQVVIVQVDGSSALSDTVADPGLFRDEATRLVTAPAPGVPLYVDTSSGSLFELAGNGRWIGTGIRPGLRSPTYVG
jgi:hypothetical protein